MTHDDKGLVKLLREGWRGDTATDLMREAADRISEMRAAYDDVVAEYAAARRDRQDQMERIRTALDDAYRGARTGNLITPHWVVQSIDDARAAGGWMLPPRSEGRES